MAEVTTTRKINLQQLTDAYPQAILSMYGDGDSDDEKTIVSGNPQVTLEQLQQALNTYAYDADYGKTPETVSLQDAYATLKQWAVEAEVLHQALATRTMTAAEQREVIRRLGIFFGKFADLIRLLGQG
jgi:hypothetical protein